MQLYRTFLSWTWLVVVFSAVAFATSIAEVPLSDMLKAADVIIVGHVDKVVMVDSKGVPVVNSGAKTGPGEGHEIRLCVTLKNETIVKGSLDLKKHSVVLPLWKMWHREFGEARKYYENKNFVFLLKRDLSPSMSETFVFDEVLLPELKKKLLQK